MGKEEDILIRNIEERIKQCLEYGKLAYYGFLDMHQRHLAQNVCNRRKGLNYLFYGGYEDAERTVAVFLPEYFSLDDSNPLALLRISHNGYKELSHRDYLGSLMGLGIKRDMVGDILVRSDGADIIILKSISQFLLANYDKAGRTNLKADILPTDSLIVPEIRYETKRDTVASLRLDSVVASAFSMPRTLASETINEGRVFINNQLCQKTDRLVKEGDKLTLRGKGKAILEKIDGLTRKDRTVIILKRFI